MELDLFFVLISYLIKCTIFGGYYLFMILFDYSLLLSYNSKFLEDFIVFVSKRTKLIDFCPEITYFLLIKFKLIFIFKEDTL